MQRTFLNLLLAITFCSLGQNSDAQNTCLNDSTYYYNALNVLTNKYYYSFDSNGKITEQVTKDSLNGVWKNVTRYLYTYSGSGLQLEFIQQNWVNNTWRNAGRRLTTYNSNDNPLTDYNYYWDTLTLSWFLANFQHTFTYNGNNELIQRLQVYVQGGAATDSSRSTYTYDANSNQLTNLIEGWSVSNPVWRNYQKLINRYNVSNKIDSTFNLIWNTITLEFDTSYLTIYQYDAQGNTLEYLNFQRSGQNWVNSSKQNYTYNAANKITLANYYNWQTPGNVWLEMQRQTVQYNAQNDPTFQLDLYYNSTLGILDSTYKTFYNYDLNNKISWLISQTWNSSNSLWDLSYKQHYFYNCVPLGLNDPVWEGVKLYPNPASNELTLVLPLSSEVTIVSLTGQKLLTSKDGFVHKLNISELPAGIYLAETAHQKVRFIKQ